MDDFELPLPPKVPLSRDQLERAIVLLGCRANGELRASKRVELYGLLGSYPDDLTAKRWKSALKKLRDDEIFSIAG